MTEYIGTYVSTVLAMPQTYKPGDTWWRHMLYVPCIDDAVPIRVAWDIFTDATGAVSCPDCRAANELTPGWTFSGNPHLRPNLRAVQAQAAVCCRVAEIELMTSKCVPRHLSCQHFGKFELAIGGAERWSLKDLCAAHHRYGCHISAPS